MKILFSTGCLFYLPIKDVFLMARDTGFEGCELVIDRHFSDMKYMDTVMECLDILPVHSIHAPFVRMKTWGTTGEVLVRTLEIARQVRAQVVNFHPPNWYTMELHFFKWFRKMKDFQEDFGCDDIALTLENMPLAGKRLMLAPYVLNNFEDLIRFGKERDLYFTFDTTHLGTFGKDLIVAFLAFLDTGRLKNVHLSDYGDFKSHRFIGAGELPMVKLLNTMRRLGYDGFITLELSPYELPRTKEWLIKMLMYQASLLKMHLGVHGDE
jgi:sugar phosphate isomerase/epimerase